LAPKTNSYLDNICPHSDDYIGPVTDAMKYARFIEVLLPRQISEISRNLDIPSTNRLFKPPGGANY